MTIEEEDKDLNRAGRRKKGRVESDGDLGVSGEVE